MRTAADSIELASLAPIANQFDVLMGYDDGNWPDADAIAAAFPGKRVIRITVDPNDNEGDMLDVEWGNAAPTDAPGWVQRRRAAGHGGPLVYCSESLWPDVIAAFTDAGVPEPGYAIAGYPGSVGAGNLYPGSVGHQYADVGPYDEWVLVDYLPGIDPAPAPPPPPSPTPPPPPVIFKPLTGRIGMLNAPMVAIVPTPTGKGYTEVGADGGTFTHGDAVFVGSLAGKPLNKPVVHAFGTPTGKGLYLVATDGGVFALGDAVFDGSEGGKALNEPVIGGALTPDGKGYWLVAADGGVFTFGDAGFFGSQV